MTSQQKTRDDIYERAGTTWQRFWVGDNSGLYVWRAHGRTLEAWQCGWARRERITADGEVVDDIEPEYRGTVDGRLVASGGAQLVCLPTNPARP